MPRPQCLVLGTLLVLALGHAQRLESDLKSLLHDTDVNNYPPAARSPNDDDFEVEFVYPRKDGGAPSGGEAAPSSSSSPPKPVRRLWGVPDTEARLGRLFSYPIPEDAFEGDVKSVRFEDLPAWLSFSSLRGVLEGVPGPADLKTHYVSVVAEGHGGEAAKDAFAIQVVNIPDTDLLKETRCGPKQELTVLSIILEKSPDMKPRNKVQLIQTISHLFLTKAKKISLIPSSLKVDPLAEDTAIMAGPGKLGTLHYSETAEATQSQMQLQWSVGCDGEINKEEQDVITNVESSSRSGKLEQAIGIRVVGWIVTQVNPTTRRAKRDLDYSGDYGDGDDDYDYNYDDYFNPPNRGAAPSLATPVFLDIPATPIPGGYPASPVFKAVPLSTPVFVPVKPTARVVEASPTLIYRSDYPTGYGEAGLESSLLTHPTTSADYTTPLTSTSSVRFGGPTRGGSSFPIEVTSVPDRGETTEYAVKNFPPRVQNRIQKLAWVAGNVYRMRIPADTFVDVEEGGTRNLTLLLKDESGSVFPRDSWIQFDPSKQEVYALPLEKHIGRYHFRLEALDRDRKSVMDNLEVTVRQHNQARIFHHLFTSVFKIEKKYEYDFAFSLDWQVKAVGKLAALFKDSVSNINVRNISSNPVIVSWTNVSLVDSMSTVCPTEELEAIAEVMLSGHGSEPSRLAKRVFLPEFHLKKIHSSFFGPCEPHFHHGHHSPDSNAHPFTPLEGSHGGAPAQKNTAPIVRNQIDQLKATVGKLFRFQVPDNTCYDMEDGNSRKLKMQILTIDLSPPSQMSWLQFDSANQEFFGLPLEQDVGRTEYLLECMDKGEKSVSDALIVEVSRPSPPPSPPPVIFFLTVDTSFDAFMSNAYDKVRLLQLVGRSFGDADAAAVSVRSLREGSVRLEWTNASLPAAPCPHQEVGRLRQVMTDDNGALRQEFKDFFLPDFRVSSGGAVVPSGSCLAGDTPTFREEADLAAPDEDEVSAPRDEDYLLTFIVPAVIIALMLLLAALIACCLYRRRRYGKMSMAGDRTFVSKGIPIIFAEELDDHRADTAKSPVIMKEEKPPLPPPEYQRNSPPRGDRPQQQQQQQRPPSADLNSTDDAPYHRPPPFTASNGASRNPRPNLPPAYRKPPTYVPP